MTGHLNVDTVSASKSEHSAADPTLGVEPPSWLRWAAFVPAAGVLALGSVGLVLAVNGCYRPVLAFTIGGAAWLGLLALARPALTGPGPLVGAQPVGPTSGSRAAHLYAAVAVAAIAVITAWNMAHASEHVLIDRDGGSYANTARWIARDGSLAVKPRVGPFANEPTVSFGSAAVFQMPDGSLQFQFAHLLPVVLAEAHAVAGDTGLFHSPELLGGFALLAFFVLAWRLLRRPLFALSAMLALAFIIPEVSFSRDSYSEIPSQILLFTALWLLVTARVLPRWRVALVAGLFLGSLEATRIDAIVFLVGVPVVCAVAWVRADAADRRHTSLPAIVAFVAGIVPGIGLGLIDLVRHSGLYFSDLAREVHKLSLATAGSAVVCLLGASTWRFVFPFLRRLPWRALSGGAALGVAFLGFGVWALRPRLQHVRGDAQSIVWLQQSEHVAVDATRLYFERSMSWMAWYLGPITLILAIIGAALIVRALLLGRMMRAASALAVLAPGSVLYLYKAQAVPDHVWVTRRFLVSAFPTLLLLALGLAAYLGNVKSTARGTCALRVGAVAVAVMAVAYPLYTLVGVRSMAEETGYLGVAKEVCDEIGPHAAVVVVESARTDAIDDWVPQALRGWCGAEVGITRGGAHADALHRLAREWTAAGRPFFVVGSSYGYMREVLPKAQINQTRSAVDTTLLAPTLTRRPDAYGSQSLTMVVARLEPG
jgi:hypothetical protein